MNSVVVVCTQTKVDLARVTMAPDDSLYMGCHSGPSPEAMSLCKLTGYRVHCEVTLSLFKHFQTTVTTGRGLHNLFATQLGITFHIWTINCSEFT
jgi:hypothetical protein